MYSIVASVTFPYARESVFAALASVEGAVRWQAGVRAVRRAPPRPTASPAGEPTLDADGHAPALLLHYWALGARHVLRTHVTAHEPPERFAYRAEGAGLAYDVCFAVRPVTEGCEVTCTLHLEGGSAAPTTAEGDVVRLRRLLVRRLPRDLARLEAWVAVQPGARRRSAVPPA